MIYRWQDHFTRTERVSASVLKSVVVVTTNKNGAQKVQCATLTVPHCIQTGRVDSFVNAKYFGRISMIVNNFGVR